MNQAPMNLSVEERFAVTDDLLGRIANRFKEGESAQDLLEVLQSVWTNVPAGTILTAEEQNRLTAMMQKLNETVAVGENWMDQATEALDLMARGRRMMKVYQT